MSPSTLAVRSAMTAIDSLYEDAASAKEILAAMTKEAYLAYQRGLFRSVPPTPKSDLHMAMQQATQPAF